MNRPILTLHDPDDATWKLREEVRLLSDSVTAFQHELWAMRDEMTRQREELAYMRAINTTWQTVIGKLICKTEAIHEP